MDEKKKMMVLGGLAVAFIGIGAFTFMPKGEEAPPTGKKDVPQFLVDNEKANHPDALPNPAVVASLSSRDPFRAPDSMLTPKDNTTTNTPIPSNRSMGGPRLASNANVAPFNVTPLPGAIPNGAADSGNATGTEEAKEPEPQFTYAVTGVAVGMHPAAVFKDAQGNQRLVMQGGALDGDSKVIAVHLDSVDILFHGKKLHLRVGGESVAKQ